MKRRPRLWSLTVACGCGVRFTVGMGPDAYLGLKHLSNTDEWSVRCVCGREVAVTVGQIKRSAA